MSILRRAFSALAIASLVPGVAAAATISTVSYSGANGNWSNTALWQGGVVPGSSDLGYAPESGTLTWDSSAPASIGGVAGNKMNLTLQKDLHVLGTALLREATVTDGGHDVTIDGQLNNYRLTLMDGNGLNLVRQGGTYTLGSVELQRTVSLQMRPGDIIDGDVHLRLHTAGTPQIVVTQDATYFSGALDEGLSLEDEYAALTLEAGVIGGTYRASSIVLNWDSGFTGPIDWTLRWKGDHASELQALYSAGQLVIGTTPSGREAFSAASHIFYDASDDYTYVGYSCQGPDTVPVYRVFDGSDDHYYTTDATEAAALVTSGWDNEGLLGYAFDSAGAGRIPVYVLEGSVDHLYTTSTVEVTFAQSVGYGAESVAFYVSTSAPDSVYRVNLSGGHVYTMSSAEATNLITNYGASDEGTLGTMYTCE